MSLSTVRPWIGTKKIAFVPVFRDSPDVVPPDVIPENWRDVIKYRVLGGPPENWRDGTLDGGPPENWRDGTLDGGPPENWRDGTLRRVTPPVTPDRRDRSLRAWLQRVSWGKADINPIVFKIRTVTQKVVEPGHFARELQREAPNPIQWLNEDRLKAHGFASAILIMLGDRGAGLTQGFWSRVVMDETNGIWMHEILHAITDIRDLYHANNDLDPRDRAIGYFDIMSACHQTHPTAFSKKEFGWLRNVAIGDFPIGSGLRKFKLRPISSIVKPNERYIFPPGWFHARRIRCIDRDVPYFMVEARQKTDYFETGGSTGTGGIRSEGVIAYRVRTPNPAQGGERPCCRKRVYLETVTALQPGQSILLDNVKVHVASQAPGGYIVHITTEPIIVPGIGQVLVPKVVEKDWEEAERLLVQTGICARMSGPKKDNEGHNTKIQTQSIPEGYLVLWGSEMTMVRA